MKRCTYCGKEYGDEADACQIDGEPLLSPEEAAAQKAQRSKRPSRQEVKTGLAVAMIGLVIGTLGAALPVYFAKGHVSGNVYVSLSTLLTGSTVFVSGLALAWLGPEVVRDRGRTIFWIGFFAGIALCILVFLKIFDLGYGYK